MKSLLRLGNSALVHVTVHKSDGSRGPTRVTRNLSTKTSSGAGLRIAVGQISPAQWRQLGFKLNNLSSTRSATRLTRRDKQQAAVKEAVEERPHDNTSVQQYQKPNTDVNAGYEQPAHQTYYEEAPPDATAESLITEDVKAHLIRVYNTIGITTALAATGGALTFLLPTAMVGTLSLVGMIGGLGALLGVIFVNKEKVMLRQNLLFGFGFLEGLAIAPMLALASPATITLALAGTGAIFAGFSLAALRAKSRTFLALGGPLMGGVLLLVGISLFGWLGPMFGVSPAVIKALYNVNLYLGLGIFSLFISFDTQQMIHDAREGHKDHVSHAMNMFLNLINVFIRLLSIFRNND